MATPTKPPNPLKSLIRLTPTVYLHHPTSHTNTSPTFILATWMNASPRHINHYISRYTHLFPSARIFLLLGTPSNMFYTSEVLQKRNLEPVIKVIQNAPESGIPIFLHAFSNAGAQQIGLLLRACAETGNSGGMEMIKGLLLDSAPSNGSFSGSYSTIATQLPTQWYIALPGRSMVLLYLSAVWSLGKLVGKLNVLSQMNRDLLDTNLLGKGTRRWYLYSREDKLVRWEEVEVHAEMAEGRGYVVGKEVFGGSEHCQHARGRGEERYWGIVREMVEAGMGDVKVKAKL